jgi:hypothetical protein
VTGCQPGTPIVCSNDDACDGLEECDPGTLACLLGEVPDCDDQNGCTADSCDQNAGCVHQPISGDCDDGTECTAGDTCEAGECVGDPICDDGNACNGPEECVDATLECLPGTAPDCDDSNECTADSCNGTLGCVHAPAAGSCDDLSACTQGDTCVAGECIGTAKSCTDGNACNGLEECVPASGACVPGAPPVCDNGDACPDSCDPTIGCVEAPCGSTSTTVQQINQAPVCDDAFADPDDLFPPNHKLVPVRVRGVIDPDGDPIAIEILSIHQDEPREQGKRARVCPDGDGVESSTAHLRAERRRKGDGRTYHVRYVARDGRGKSCDGTVTACVPHNEGGGGECGDQGPLVDSTEDLCDGDCRDTCDVEVRVAHIVRLCDDGPLPKFVQARVDQAHLLVAKGAGLVSRGKSKRMISASIRMLQKTARAVFKAEREGTVTPDCSTLLIERLQDAKAAAEIVLEKLKSPQS